MFMEAKNKKIAIIDYQMSNIAPSADKIADSSDVISLTGLNQQLLEVRLFYN